MLGFQAMMRVPLMSALSNETTDAVLSITSDDDTMAATATSVIRGFARASFAGSHRAQSSTSGGTRVSGFAAGGRRAGGN